MEQIKSFFKARTKLELVGMVVIIFSILSFMTTSNVDYSKRMKDLEASNQTMIKQMSDMRDTIVSQNKQLMIELYEKDAILMKKFILFEDKIDKRQMTFEELQAMKVF